ncbi:unnamed protein product [Mytilus edulis]|uniref:BED-type domain-containing protein n=1 Tax=Mytilus edulis TaxID=6550 RepID=A0A8S3TQR6_MYTED|nr:unnamed protein product [Mytilus edulis]
MSSKSVLEHFTVPDDFQNGNTFKGKCMHCGTLISGSYKVTSNFVTHMKRKHRDLYILHSENKEIQPTLTQCIKKSVKYSPSDPKQLEMTNALIMFIAGDLLPLSIVENVPDELNYVTYEPKENFSETQGKLLCKDGTKTQNKDQIYHKAIISILKLPTLQQNIDERDENTLTGTIMEYKWILSNETTKEIAINDTQLYVYTCERNDSNTTEELPSNDTLHIYYSNKTVYLRDPENYATGWFECNADNIARLDESQNCPAEGYSSIDRRRRIEVGQMVSYKASRVSRSSKANESGYGLVEFNTDTVSPKFHIHGSGNETPYADIDITLKADPLPESDSSEEEDPDTNSDLLKLDDIIKLTNLIEIFYLIN